MHLLHYCSADLFIAHFYISEWDSLFFRGGIVGNIIQYLYFWMESHITQK